jgi:hypothetical protein
MYCSQKEARYENYFTAIIISSILPSLTPWLSQHSTLNQYSRGFILLTGCLYACLILLSHREPGLAVSLTRLGQEGTPVCTYVIWARPCYYTNWKVVKVHCTS